MNMEFGGVDHGGEGAGGRVGGRVGGRPILLLPRSVSCSVWTYRAYMYRYPSPYTPSLPSTPPPPRSSEFTWCRPQCPVQYMYFDTPSPPSAMPPKHGPLLYQVFIMKHARFMTSIERQIHDFEMGNCCKVG